jgi:hypothetical protein
MTAWIKPEFDQGATVSLAARLTVDDVPVDAATVVLKVKSPGGLVATMPFNHDGEGLFSADVGCNASGKWWFRWESIAPTTAEEGHFVIRESNVLPHAN